MNALKAVSLLAAQTRAEFGDLLRSAELASELASELRRSLAPAITLAQRLEKSFGRGGRL